MKDTGDIPIIVEVFAKHQDDDQKKLLNAIEAGETPPGVGRSTFTGSNVTAHFTTAVLQPGGASDPEKPNDSVQANLISRVCAAKGNESQLSDDSPSLLWIDFRTFGPWPEGLDIQQTSPLISGRDGTLCSGALWYAFYGWRNAPIFETDFSQKIA
jgi:hypothetical protein